MSDTPHEKVKPVQQDLPFEPTFDEIEINGVSVLTATINDKPLISMRDTKKLLGYVRNSCTENLRNACTASGHSLDEHISMLIVTTPDKSIAMEFIDIKGLEVLCAVVPPARTNAIRKWLIWNAPQTFAADGGTAEIGKVFSANLAGYKVRVAFIRQKPWLAVQDLGPLANYKTKKSTNHLGLIFRRNGEDIRRFQINLRYAGRVPPAFINANGIEVLCRLIKSASRTEVLRTWLVKFGSWSGDVDALIAAMSGTEICDAQEVVIANRECLGMHNYQIYKSKLPAAPEPAPVATPPAQPAPQSSIAKESNPAARETERNKDYCKKLCSVVARYLTAEELPALAQALETFKSNVLAKRYAPGLNDAAYELFANFHLRGPAVGQAGKEAQ